TSTPLEMATQRRCSVTARCSLSEALSISSGSPPRCTVKLQARCTAPRYFRPPNVSADEDLRFCATASQSLQAVEELQIFQLIAHEQYGHEHLGITGYPFVDLYNGGSLTGLLAGPDETSVGRGPDPSAGQYNFDRSTFHPISRARPK